MQYEDYLPLVPWKNPALRSLGFGCNVDAGGRWSAARHFGASSTLSTAYGWNALDYRHHCRRLHAAGARRHRDCAAERATGGVDCRAIEDERRKDFIVEFNRARVQQPVLQPKFCLSIYSAFLSFFLYF
jgi:hypothetical protein